MTSYDLEILGDFDTYFLMRDFESKIYKFRDIKMYSKLLEPLLYVSGYKVDSVKKITNMGGIIKCQSISDKDFYNILVLYSNLKKRPYYLKLLKSIGKVNILTISGTENNVLLYREKLSKNDYFGKLKSITLLYQKKEYKFVTFDKSLVEKYIFNYKLALLKDLKTHNEYILKYCYINIPNSLRKKINLEKSSEYDQVLSLYNIAINKRNFDKSYLGYINNFIIVDFIEKMALSISSNSDLLNKVMKLLRGSEYNLSDVLLLVEDFRKNITEIKNYEKNEYSFINR